jgi:hypothetical protein
MAGLWFKMWASTFLTDGEIDSLPDAAVVLLVKMRCICCIEGACPKSPFEVARKTRTAESTVLAMMPLLVKLKFFQRRGDLLFDVEQERDAALSERGKRGALAANSRRRATSGGTSDAQPSLAMTDATSDATSGGSSDATVPPATSDATSGGTSDAKKLEVRSKKQEHSVDVVGSVEGYTVVGPVEAVENSENVPTGTLSIDDLKKKSESAFHQPSRNELERRRQDQKQRLQQWQKQRQTTTNTNPNDEFKLA